MIIQDTIGTNIIVDTTIDTTLQLIKLPLLNSKQLNIIENHPRLLECYSSLKQCKEEGHSLASQVENVVASIVNDLGIGKVEFPRYPDGTIKKRSHIDFYLENIPRQPVNVKCTGRGGGGTGSPNMVSFKKIAKFVATEEIDCYWILTIMYNKSTTHIKAVLWDLLQNLHLCYQDFGPGQIMLCSSAFYKNNMENVNFTHKITRKEIRDQLLEWNHKWSEWRDNREKEVNITEELLQNMPI